MLHHIKKLENRDQDRFNRLFSAFEIGFRRRAKLEQFELSGKYKFPRFPSKKSAIAEITRLVKEKIIVIGQSQLAETITATHHVTGKKFEIVDICFISVTFHSLYVIQFSYSHFTFIFRLLRYSQNLHHACIRLEKRH